MKVSWISVTGQVTVEHNVTTPSYPKMEKFLKGPVERFELRVVSEGKPKGVKAMMYVNENGGLVGEAINHKATQLVVEAARLMNTVCTQYIRGNVIVTEPDDKKPTNKEKKHG
jgi:hypothetical protein